MKLPIAFIAVLFLAISSLAQSAPTSVTVPITLDHNRIIVDVRFPMPDGTPKRVRCWVDSGNPDMWITEALATKLGLPITGDPQEALFGKQRMTQPPSAMLIGGMPIHPTGVKEAHAILDREAVGPGLSAEINLPSTVLRDYDVTLDYPNRELTLSKPGSTHFHGQASKATINTQNGLIQIPSILAGEKYNLALDVGASFGLVSSDLVSKLHKAHPQWPEMTGAVGSANLWGLESEPRWELLRIPTMQFGNTTLTGVGVSSFDQEAMSWFEKRAGVATVGLMGANALLNYRVGIDYAHSKVYLEKTSKFDGPDMDVVGVILRPEADERYTVVGVAEYDGKPSVLDVRAGDALVSIDQVPAKGGTMGQVWSLLSGSPGDIRELTFERYGKQFTVKAVVRRFLAAPPADVPLQK